MTLQRWDPFNELRRMQETMNHLWWSFGAGTTDGQEMETWAVPLDVVQQGDNFVIRASHARD
jgi:HSP20 family protein